MIHSCLPNVMPSIVNSVNRLSSHIRSGFEKFVSLFQCAKSVPDQFEINKGSTFIFGAKNVSGEFVFSIDIFVFKVSDPTQTTAQEQYTIEPFSTGYVDTAGRAAESLTAPQWWQRLIGGSPAASSSSGATLDDDGMKEECRIMALESLAQFRGEILEGKNLIALRMEQLQAHCQNPDSTEPLSKLDDTFRGLHVNLRGVVLNAPEGREKELTKEMVAYFDQFKSGGEWIPMEQAREMLAKLLEYRAALQFLS